jgi:hypothetical protein
MIDQNIVGVLSNPKKSFMINYVLNFVANSFSMYKTKEFVKNNLLFCCDLVLTIFMVENTYFLVIIKIKRVSTCKCKTTEKIA